MLMTLALWLQDTVEYHGNPVPFLVGGLLVYAFVAYSFMTIAEKTGTPNGWFAWIPILNIVLLLQIARKPVWWIILFLIPLVNIVIWIIVLAGVCQARGKSGWLVLGLLIPLVNLAVIGYLAFAD